MGQLEYSFSILTKENLIKFVVEYFQETMDLFNSNINEITEQYSKELSNRVKTFHIDFNKTHDNLLEVGWTTFELENQLKNYVFENIYKKFEIFTIKKSFNFISIKLIKGFENFFYATYIEIMETKKFKTLTNNILKISFDKIEQKIQEYYNRNNENIPVQNNQIKEEPKNEQARLLVDEEMDGNENEEINNIINNNDNKQDNKGNKGNKDNKDNKI
jgi:DNA-binding cell septation regulator SpoVG